MTIRALTSAALVKREEELGQMELEEAVRERERDIGIVRDDRGSSGPYIVEAQREPSDNHCSSSSFAEEMCTRVGNKSQFEVYG